MKSLSRILFIAIYFLIGSALMTKAIAQSNLDNMARLLIEIPGWQAEKPDLMSMNQAGVNLAYAARLYQQGDKKIMAMLGRSGLEQQAEMMTGGRQGDLNFENGDTSISVRSIRGFRVFSVYNSSDKEGMIVVFLGGGQHSTFVFQFDGIALDDGLTQAQRFDWTAMQRTTAGR